MLATGVLSGFSIEVWALHARLCWPILAAIAVRVAGYCAVGTGIARVRPTGDAVFWISVSLMLAMAVTLVRLLSHREERYDRTPLPVWIKMPAIALVTGGLVTIKQLLGGFTTMFPMVTVVATYEALHSLGMIMRWVLWVMLTMLPMMAVIRLTQEHVGLPAALAVAWPFLLSLLWLFRSHYSGVRGQAR